MKRFWLSLAILACLGSLALAQDVLESDFVFRDGFYWKGELPYTREKVYSGGGGWWYCGRYYSTPQTYSYHYSRAAVYTPTLKVPAYSPTWKTEIIKYAEARDDYAAYLQALSVVGLHGQTYSFQQGSYLPQGTGYASSTTAYGANATTQYGVSTAAQFYQDNNLNLLFQAAGQGLQDVAALHGQAITGVNTLAATEGGYKARIAEAIARGEMAARIIQALQAPGVVETKQFQFHVSGDGQVQRDDSQVTPETKAELKKQWISLVNLKCAKCHSGSSIQGGFNLNDYPTMPVERKQAVWARLTSADQAKMMPRDLNDKTKPGTPLTQAEFKLFLVN